MGVGVLMSNSQLSLIESMYWSAKECYICYIYNTTDLAMKIIRSS